MHTALSEERLMRNLRAIGARDPRLVERLIRAVASDHVEIDDSLSGLPVLRIFAPGCIPGARANPLVEAEAAVKTWSTEGEHPILLLGVGFGYHLEALLKHGHPCRKVIAYERDPYLLRLTLLRADLSRDVLSGRLSFALGTDLAPAVAECHGELQVIPHPLFSVLYVTEQAFLADVSVRRSQETRRALVATGGLFVEDVIDTLRARGLETLAWSPGRVSLEETRHQIQTFAPHFVFSINYVQSLPEVCEELGIPYIVWEIDPVIERPGSIGRSLGRTHVFTYRRANIPMFRRMGLRNVEHLPLATHPGRRFPMDGQGVNLDDYRCDVSFVGSSMRQQAATLRGIFESLAGEEAPGGSSSHRENWTSTEWWRRETPDAYVSPNELTNGAPRFVKDSRGRTVDLLYCLAETAASERRRQVVASLDARGCHIWGDADWREALPRSNYRGEAGHYRELTLIYNASRVNLDINRIYQRDIVAMRVFDVLACNAFVLADHSEDLADLFEIGTEVAAYRSDSEVPGLVAHYLRNPSERIAIARAGYEKVLRAHTIAHRMDAIFSRVNP